jgi:hypothetical protein
MSLLKADILLERAACYQQFWKIMTNSERATVRPKLSHEISRARVLVERIGYGRRRNLLSRLEGELAAVGEAT